ncbi:hypothetical protein EDD11_002238 [Mortierella claussenii]|nr:hypothetical protein EDD11_002238 [Mortierella claussenii]
MAKRQELIAVERRVSYDDDLLAINFIFVESFLSPILSEAAMHAIFDVDLPFPKSSDIAFLTECASSALRGNVQLEKAVAAIETRGGREYPMFSAIKFLCSTQGLWDKHSMNEGNYHTRIVEPIVRAFFLVPGVEYNCINAKFPMPPNHNERLFPDIFVQKDKLPLVMVEIKKPAAKKTDRERDVRKVLCMMKLSLNMLLGMHIEDPVVVGVLVQDTYFEILSMQLEHEALYFPRVLGSFQVPTCPGGLGALLTAFSPLTEAKRLMEATLVSINRRPKVPFDDPGIRDTYRIRT